MAEPVMIAERTPTVDEYLQLIAAVSWRPRESDAVMLALRNSLFAVCAESEGKAIGCGRVIGDGGLHLYLTDIIVHPDYQRRGAGTLIVDRLMKHVESVPYQNLLVAVLPTPGLAGFYAKHGFNAMKPHNPAMQRWVNPT